MGMINKGMCPHCEFVLKQVELEMLELTVQGVPTQRGYSMVCPHCQIILGVGFAPLSMNQNLIDDVDEMLAAKRS
jgi:hypothetical protein